MIKTWAIILFLLLVNFPTFAKGDDPQEHFTMMESFFDSKEKVDSLNKLSQTYRKTSPDWAMKFAQSGFDIAKALKYEAGMAESLSKRGILEKISGDLSKALKSYDDSIEKWEKLGNEEKIASVNNNKAIVFKNQGNYEKALSAYLDCLKIFQKLKKRSLEARVLNNIGLVHQNLENYETALDNHSRAYKIYDEEKSQGGLANTLINQAICNDRMGRSEEVIGLYNEAKKIFDDLGYERGKAELHYNLGAAHFNLKNSDSSIYHYFKCIDLFDKVNRQVDLSGLYFNLGNVYLSRPNYDSTKKYLEKSEALLEGKESQPKLESRLWNTYSMMYENLGKHQEAFFYLKKAKKIDEFLYEEDKTKERSKLLKDFELNQKEQENVQLQAQNETKTAERNALGLGILLLLLIGLGSFLFYHQKVKSQRLLVAKNRELEKERILKRVEEQKVIVQNSELEKQSLLKKLKEQEVNAINEMVQMQENERKRIAGELHDKVGSMLTGIKLNFSSIKDKIGKEAMPVAQTIEKVLDQLYDRVRKISHEMDTGFLKQDGLIPALEEIKEVIESSKKLSVTIDQHGMKERLPRGIEMLLYQVIQELITNVIKYADATEITLTFTRLEGEVNLIFEDNGKGFDTEKKLINEGIGLKNIHYKVRQRNGSFDIDSVAKRGTSISINLPIEDEKS